MNTTLFEPIGVNQNRPRLALGGAVQVLRARRGWKVADAAVAVGLAPMTWRRIESGQQVRPRSYLALDTLFEVDPGTVTRALRDDVLMVELIRVAGVDTRHVAPDNAGEFLDTFVRQTAPTAPVLPSQPVVTPQTMRALAAAADHVPSVRPTNLELTHRLIEQLLATAVPTPAVKALLKTAMEAVPDLMAAQLRDVEVDCGGTRETSTDDELVSV